MTQRIAGRFIPKGAFPNNIKSHVANDVMDINALALSCCLYKLLHKQLRRLVHDLVVVLQAAASILILLIELQAVNMPGLDSVTGVIRRQHRCDDVLWILETL